MMTTNLYLAEFPDGSSLRFVGNINPLDRERFCTRGMQALRVRELCRVVLLPDCFADGTGVVARIQTAVENSARAKDCEAAASYGFNSGRLSAFREVLKIIEECRR